jgi:neutral ceramidase
MAGRRLRNTVRDTLKRLGALSPDTVVVIAGLSNSYSHYVVTYQEYQEQRYEGASTLFGPHTLAAYQQIYDYLVSQLVLNKSVPVGPLPIDMRNHTFSFIIPPPPDTAPLGKHFGAVESDAQASYTPGQTVSVTFWGASPRNDLMTEKTFLTVENQNSAGQWVVICDDSCWETKFHWSRVLLTESKVTCEWTIPMDVQPGNYRIQHFGNSKDVQKNLHPYSGASRTFAVKAK